MLILLDLLLGMMDTNRQMFFLFQAQKEKSQVSVCGCFLFALRSQIIFGMFNNMGYASSVAATQSNMLRSMLRS